MLVTIAEQGIQGGFKRGFCHKQSGSVFQREYPNQKNGVPLKVQEGSSPVKSSGKRNQK